MAEADDVQERNKASIQQFVEQALNRGNLEIVDATRGAFAEGGRARIQELRSAFPDLVTTIHPIVAEHDWVAHGWFTGEPILERSVGFHLPAGASSSRRSR